MAILNDISIKVVDLHVKRIYPIYEADYMCALTTLNMNGGNRNDEQLKNVLVRYQLILKRIKGVK